MIKMIFAASVAVDDENTRLRVAVGSALEVAPEGLDPLKSKGWLNIGPQTRISPVVICETPDLAVWRIQRPEDQTDDVWHYVTTRRTNTNKLMAGFSEVAEWPEPITEETSEEEATEAVEKEAEAPEAQVEMTDATEAPEVQVEATEAVVEEAAPAPKRRRRSRAKAS